MVVKKLIFITIFFIGCSEYSSFEECTYKELQKFPLVQSYTKRRILEYCIEKHRTNKCQNSLNEIVTLENELSLIFKTAPEAGKSFVNSLLQGEKREKWDKINSDKILKIENKIKFLYKNCTLKGNSYL